MPRKFPCPICGRTFVSYRAEFEHFKKEHVGSQNARVETLVYCLRQGIPPEKLLREFPEEKVREALRLFKGRQLTLGVF